MQEVHWTTGLIGYFPVYLLGRMAARGLYRKMLSEIPGLLDDIGIGKLDRVHDFLSEKIFRFGSLYAPDELLEPVIGNEYHKQYVEYLGTLNS
jgi:carboxypeptidase Taq